MIKITRDNIGFFLLTLYTISLIFWEYLLLHKIAIAILVLGTILVYLRNTKSILHKESYIIVYSLFTIYFIIHTMLGLARDESAAWKAITTLIMNAVIGVCCIRILSTNREMLIKFMKMFIIVSLACCIYILIIKHNAIFSGELTRDCVKLFSHEYYSHNDVPGYAVISLFFLMYLASTEKEKRFTRMLLSVFFFIFILLSGARKSLIGAIIAIVVFPYLFANNKKKLTTKIIRIGIICFVFILIYILMTKVKYLYEIIGYKFEDLLNGFTSGEFEESSSSSRNEMIQVGTKLIKDRVFTGYGLRAWSTWYGLIGSWSHNMLVELTFSGGILATLLYYSFFVIFFRKLGSASKDDLLGKMLICYMIFMIIHDMLSVSYLSRIVGLMFCFVNSYLILKEKETQYMYGSDSIQKDA